MVAVLLYQTLQIPPVGEFIALIVQEHSDGRTLFCPFGFLNRIFLHAVGSPLPSLILTILSGQNLNLSCNHEHRIEADAELADQTGILLLLISEILQELLGSTSCDGTQVIVELIMTHSNSIIRDHQSLLVTLCIRKLNLQTAFHIGSRSEKLILELVQSIRRVGDKLSEKDLLVGIKRMDDQVQKLRNLSLELFSFHIIYPPE